MTACKFKVGDRVRILPRKEKQEEQYPCYVDEMLDYIGEIVTIIEIQSGDIILLDAQYLDDQDYRWHEDWLELVTPRKKRILK